MDQERQRRQPAISRRKFLHMSSLATAGVIAAACVPALPEQTAPAATEAAPAAMGQTYNEAPLLAERVQAGDLPPVDARLPANPMVVEPVERVGRYGGTWRTGLVGGSDNAWLVRTLDYEHLTRWNPDWTEVIPNVAEGYEVSDDAMEYVFTLREGMKWSDGEPFTADDILFWWEDVATNEQLSPGGPPSWMVIGGEPGAVEKIDDYQVRFTFSTPNGFLLQQLATPGGAAPTSYPKHYLQQFHVDYNDQNLDDLMAEAGATDWINLFQLKGASIQGTPYDARWQNSELPTLYGWVLTTPYGESTQVVAERNPYYWKVDTAGNQLPYLDRVVNEVLESPEVLLLKVLNGEVDMHTRHINTLDNKAVLTDSMEAGEYHFFDTYITQNTLAISVNLTHKDPVKREIFQNKDFRIGLSHAINRPELIDLVYVGQGVPAHTGLQRGSSLYHEQLDTQYLEYDVDLANQYLDNAGYAERDAQGIRLGPDGERITIVLETSEALRPDWADVAELVVTYWQNVGIDTQLRLEDRSLLYARKEANDHDAMAWSAAWGGIEGMLDPRFYFPFSSESHFAEAWQTWRNNPDSPIAEEPPAVVKQQMDLYEQLKATNDQAQQRDLMLQILDIAAEQFYFMGISTHPPGYGIVRNNFHNVPATMPEAWQYPTPAPTNPVQYFIEE